MLCPDQALLHYPDLCQGPIQGQPQVGLNGGVCFRVHATIGDLCLKAWPVIDPKHLAQVHRLLHHARADQLDFVPRLYPPEAGITFYQDPSHRCWDLTTWMPGQTLELADITAGQVRSATTALAQLHLSWATKEQQRLGPVPAVSKRLETCQFRRSLGGFKRDPRPNWSKEDFLKKAESLLQRWLPQVPHWLYPWLERSLPLQWRHGDPWRGNLLFEGERLTGLIDFGAAIWDSPLADLARLLGSLAEDDATVWQAGLDAYAKIRTLNMDERELLPLLDRSGALGALSHWLDKFALSSKPLPDFLIHAATVRLTELVGRIEKWQ